jgi:pimeloyl-ACP methyl ester carboxylesterase
MRTRSRSFLAALVVLGACAWTHADVKSGYAPVNDLQMYYEIRGNASADQVPLVLLHGGGSTIKTSFADTVDLFAKSRQVIAVEQQGHGHTADIADRPFTFEQSADDTAALLQFLKIDRADFAGYSNGGTIALHIAIRHPQIVRKIVSISGMYKRDACDQQFWEGFKHASVANMPAELKEAYRQTAPHPEQLQSFHDKSVQRMIDFKDIPDEQMRSIAAPALVIVGDADIVRPEHAVAMFRILPHAQLAILPGTDHMAIVHRSDWLVSMISAFLDAKK